MNHATTNSRSVQCYTGDTCVSTQNIHGGTVSLSTCNSNNCWIYYDTITESPGTPDLPTSLGGGYAQCTGFYNCVLVKSPYSSTDTDSRVTLA